MLRTPPRTRGRSEVLAAVGRIAVLAVVSSLLVLVPAPRVEATETMVVDSHTPELGPAVRTVAPGSTVRVAASGEDVTEDLLDPTRRAAREEAAPFDLLGVTVAQRPDDHLLVRVRSDGAWGTWMELEMNPDHDVEGGEAATAAARQPGVHSAPIWVDGADAYELNVPASVGAVEVNLVRREVRTVELDAPRQRRRRGGSTEHPQSIPVGSARREGDTGCGPRPEDRRRAPLGELEQLQRAGRPRHAARHPGVPHGRAGLERHRLQLRGRPLRPHLGGARAAASTVLSSAATPRASTPTAPG